MTLVFPKTVWNVAWTIHEFNAMDEEEMETLNENLKEVVRAGVAVVWIQGFPGDQLIMGVLA